jgi:hypothetical protein
MKLCGPWRSRLQLMGDYILSHVLFALPRSIVNRERQITTKSGIKISYRLNRGDLQGIREVWCDEVYRLPFAAPAGAFLDLGANIGLTTVWMATHNQFSRIIAIEPDCENATLATKNIQQNGIPGEVLQAAVGPSDGTVCFQKALFLGPSEWLRHTGAMVVEFHPNMVDYPLLTKTVASQGFEYIPASPRNMDCFLRIAAN